MGMLASPAFEPVLTEEQRVDQILDALQLEQFEHDEKYHREISRLTTQDRLKQMPLLRVGKNAFQSCFPGTKPEP